MSLVDKGQLFCQEGPGGRKFVGFPADGTALQLALASLANEVARGALVNLGLEILQATGALEFVGQLGL